MKAAIGEPESSTIDYFKIPAVPAPYAPAPYPVGADAALAAVAAGFSDRLLTRTEFLEEHFEGLGDGAGTSLEDFGEMGSRLVQDLQAAATGDLDGLGDLVGGELTADLGSAAGTLLDGAAPHLADRLAGLADVVGAGLDVMGLAAAIAPPIEWARGVVETIGNLLETMALGL